MRKHVFIAAEDARLKSYGAVSKGGATVLRIELLIDRPYALAQLLEQLAEFQLQQQVDKPARAGRGRQAQRLLPPPGSYDE